MTSFGATEIVRENYMPCFKIQGQVYHRVGSLLPTTDSDPKFLQIYFIGEKNEEVDRRVRLIDNVNRNIVLKIQEFLHEHNELVRLFKTVLPQMKGDDYKIVIKADKTPRGEHEKRYNAPTAEEVAIVIVGEEFSTRDIVLSRRNGALKRIMETHRSYDPLQYPLLFWQGEDGYHFAIKMRDPQTGQETTKKVSSMNFYSYRLMIREKMDNHILMCRELFHQYAVDMYAKIESERLLYIRLNQTKLRSEEYIHLRDALAKDGGIEAGDVGKMVILPSSFVGGPRHLHEYAQDGLCYVQHYGRPDLFITFTCNPAWDEIRENLRPGQVPADRPDLTARVFKQKLKTMIDFIVKFQVFGEVKCWMYAIEWQKRGLPHCHALIWLVEKITPDQLDEVISAEIPNREHDPELFEVVTKFMVHGPCGAFNDKCPCMKEGRCTKRYPRNLHPETISGNDGYPEYRRRSIEDGGLCFSSTIRGIKITIDNRWIVPYSPLLSKTFKAHINVEYCHSVKAIKYIFKYITKGHDMAVFRAEDSSNTADEVQRFQVGRYISSGEAVWRIFSFPIHERYPTVQHLAVHLENGQRVYFTQANLHARVASPPETTLTGFFRLCQEDEFARSLLYSEIPKYFTWNTRGKKFQRRKQGTPVVGWPNLYSTDALGRVYTVNPRDQECFYLRLLLVNVRGPKSFVDLKTVNGHVYNSYRETCLELKLLENDTHWFSTMNDASHTSHPRQIRTLFAIILTACSPSNPIEIWEKFKDNMGEDLLHQVRVSRNDMAIPYTADIYNEVLILLENTCLTMINKQLKQLGMPEPNRSLDVQDRDLSRETGFDVEQLSQFVKIHVPMLVPEQRTIYEKILEMVTREIGGLLFVDAPGGTGKTFLIAVILAKIRSEGRIALAIASSGIAATLLDGGRTAHSALKLPLDLQAIETPTCNVKKQSGMATVLRSCKLIVWDECTMTHKKGLEALDRTLKDLRNNSRPFGGALILLSGDFRQTLPIISRGTPADELNACLKLSYLWRGIRKLTLHTNMRVHLMNDVGAEDFAKQLLRLGEGKLPIEKDTNTVALFRGLCTEVPTQIDLIQKVFPHIEQNYTNQSWLGERAILAPKNLDVNNLNILIQEKIPGESTTFKSIDTVVDENESVNYPTEFLNSLDLAGIPPHDLTLKVGSPVICLRNINPPRLCNGTRIIVTKLMDYLIEGTILNGKYQRETVLIPRIPMIPNDLTFKFKRLQFPLRLAYAMTINKAQGQSFRVCGVNLEKPCFSHGQLYVAFSRVGSPLNLFVFSPGGRTKNIVYPKALE